MKRKIVFKGWMTAAALAVAAPMHAAEAKAVFASVIPNPLSQGSFYERIRHDATVSAGTPCPYCDSYRLAAGVSGSFAILTEAAPGARANCRARDAACPPSNSKAKTWTLYGSGLMVLGLMARRMMTTET